MAGTKAAAVKAEAFRLNSAQLANLGGEIRRSRKRRRLTQAQLGALVGTSGMTISRIECGRGGGVSLDFWQSLAVAIGRPLRWSMDRDAQEEPADAGHLAIQSLLLRLGRRAGHVSLFELPTRPADPSRSVDVGWRDDRRHILVLLEAWNSFGDIGASSRSFARKMAEAESLATGTWGFVPHLVVGCWVVRATRRNRVLVQRYSDIFASHLPGSSARWVRAIRDGSVPPREAGLIWCDVNCTRVFAWRRGA